MATAVIFPGQGSQQVGMLGSLLDDYLPAKQMFVKASDLLGYDLVDLITNNPDDKLNQTQYTQPALLATEYAFWLYWQANHSLKPNFLAGHSLGEYTALVCAGAISFEDAILLVKLRGELMQQAVAEGVGAMAAVIGLEDAVVAKVCREVTARGATVTPANYNSPGQVVISGYANAVDAAMELAKAKGAKLVKRLAVSVPSHSPLMKSAADGLAIAIKSVPIQSPTIPVLHNIDAEIHTDLNAIRQALVSQLYSPVRWVETIEKMASHGINTVIECGPGKVLTGLSKRINSAMVFQQVSIG